MRRESRFGSFMTRTLAREAQDVRATEVSAMELRAPEVRGESLLKTPDKPLTVLVIEDDPLDFEILSYSLSSAGFRPDCRRVDTEADFVSQLTPDVDVVLSDYT